MPNIKSAIKRTKVIEKKTMQNNMVKSAYKTAVKKFEQAIAEGNVEEATKLFSEATKKVDQACTKGVIVQNKKLCTVFYFKIKHIKIEVLRK